ncbi:MAG: ATP-binding protein, partial [Thermodesulfobacteriota bacterium]|nr:ATP-binding protein [Thermodesulfobacteriota bacterium]
GKLERLAVTGKLANGVVHEINNPLGIIRNYLRIVGNKMSFDDPTKEDFKIIEDEIERIVNILKKLSDFSDVMRGEAVSTQVNKVIEDLVSLIREQLESEHIEVELDLDGNLPEAMIFTDHLKQVFLNLVKNSREAMHHGGRLTIKTTVVNNEIHICISDTGEGISEKDIEKIFDPFYSTKPESGTGLGLAISLNMIEKYGGIIRVESEKSKGSTFIIVLPLKQE